MTTCAHRTYHYIGSCGDCDKENATMKFDLTKPLQTRDGRTVRILCTDGPEKCFPVVGFVDGSSSPIMWTLSGYWRHGSDKAYGLDLINVPPPKKKAKVFVELRRDREDGELYGVATVNRLPYKTEHAVLASTEVEFEYEDQS